MKKLFVLYCFVFANCYNFYSQYTQIPDPIFEQSLITQGVDTDSMPDGQVLTSNIDSLTSLYVTGGISSMQGIEDFINLVELKVVDNENLSSLDLSFNTNLKKVECYDNQLNNLNITNCTLLEFLNCEQNLLTQINITSNTLLISLTCNNNYLTELDVTSNLNINNISCFNNFLTSIDISNLSYLYYFECFNNDLTTINIASNSVLKYLGIRNNNFVILDVSQNFLLEFLNCSYNQISNLELSNNSKLSVLNCSFNNITSLYLNNNPFNNLPNDFFYPFLDCSNNNLTSLYLQNGNNLFLNGTLPPPLDYILRFNASNNPNLSCIYVGDVANCNTNWLGKDATSTYVATQAQCNAAVLANNEVEVVSNLNIYPNPVSDLLNINKKNDITISSINIFNTLGQLVLVIPNAKETQSVDVSTLQSGNYFVKINSDKGTATTKFVKM